MSVEADAASLVGAGGAQSTSSPQNFNLLRWFSLLSLLTILITGTAMAAFLTHYLTDSMLRRDAEVTREFIESIVTAEDSFSSFEARQPNGTTDALDRFVRHLPTLPDVIGANLYAADQTVLWSSEKSIIGRRFDSNDELEEALQNEIVAESGVFTVQDGKPEHVWLTETFLRNIGERFVEAYLPIRDATGQRVVAVVEIYKLPKTLFRSIDNGVRLVWASAAIMGLVLYGSLFWIVRRANRIMHEQRERLVETETLSVIGEMAAAVAHSIRNPLASIRSAAELAHEEEGSALQQCLQNITSQTDRLDGWIRELLAASRGGVVPVEKVDLNAVIKESLDGVASELQRRGITLTVNVTPLPPVRGTRAPLAHAIRSVIANAVEAMPQGGHLRVESRPTNEGHVEVVIEDTGVGMPAGVAQRAFKPLFTTKPNGVGLGLALSRRIVERHAGWIDLDSREGRGTRVVLNLPVGG
jgi:two-component system, NtrC family, sensor histidine kinase HydH